MFVLNDDERVIVDGGRLRRQRLAYALEWMP